MGRYCYGPKMTWADLVMGLNDPEPSSSLEYWIAICQSPASSQDHLFHCTHPSTNNSDTIVEKPGGKSAA